MTRSIPQLVSIAGISIGILLFVFTLFTIDLEETVASAARLGLALPIILVPGLLWHLLRTWGWAISFPDDTRPAFTRLFRVRLAADAVSFFTVRGLTSEPLKVVLLFDRIAPEVTAAACALERLAFAVMNTLIAGVISYFAVTRLSMPGVWNTVFTAACIAAVIVLPLVAFAARRQTGDFLGRLVTAIDRHTGRRLGASRVVQFILAVEDVLLALLRAERRRLLLLAGLPLVCFALMVLEIWLVFWAIGQPIGLMEGLAIETFARLASVASALIPANVGALEASNSAVVTMLGLAGGGSLALARRIRALLWAGLGLALYPQPKAHTRAQGPKPKA